VVSGSSQSTALNANFPNAIQVKILDQYGSPYAGATVVGVTPGVAYGTWLSNSSITKSVVTNASGIADFGTLKASGSVQTNWAVTMTGNAFVAGVDSFAASVTVSGLSNVDATIVTQMLVTQGDGQITQPSTAFARALQVRATNGLGNGVQNFAVTFTAPGSAATCTFAGSSTQLVNTDVNGYATSAVPVASATDGAYNVTASGAGVTSKTIGLQNGNVYAPEVCTAFVNLPGPNSNISQGAVGATPANWSNVGNASAAAQGGTSASNGQQPPNSNRSNGLYLFPLPAAWASIPDDAKITSLSLNFSALVATVSTQVGTGSVLSGLIQEGAPRTTFSTENLALDVWKNASKVYTPSSVPMTGAQLKNNTGFYLNFAPASNFGASQNCRVNGCQVKVCYQTVVPPPVRLNMPLMFCDA
jgi:hypothetical protein